MPARVTTGQRSATIVIVTERDPLGGRSRGEGTAGGKIKVSDSVWLGRDRVPKATGLMLVLLLGKQVGAGAGSGAGNRLPWPGRLSTSIEPPKEWLIRLTIERPRPTPVRPSRHKLGRAVERLEDLRLLVLGESHPLVFHREAG